MPKKILLIENDAAFASELARALEDAAFEVRVTGDGKEAIDLAREWSPQAIALCVELSGMSGYLVCQKLRKDDALKDIPLVLTSAEATAATIENHKKLKVRADAYLLKPYAPDALVDALAALVGLPEREDAGEPALEADAEPLPDEELVDLEEEMGLEALSTDRVEDLPALDLASLPDEPVASPAGALEDDLKLLDDAFEGLAAPSADEGALELDLGTPVKVAAELAPSIDDGPAPDRAGALDEDDAALGALGEDAIEAERPALRGASADLLRAAGIRLLDDADAPREAAPDDDDRSAGARPAARGRELADARDDELRALRARADGAQAELAALRARLDAATAAARDAEDELDALRRRAEDAERRAEEAEAEGRRRADAAAAAAGARAEALEGEIEALRTDLLVARGEAEGARGEVEKRTAELRRRLAELEGTSAKNEERIVKAYQKIKADERIREKTRKALAIATQLLGESAPAEPAPEKDKEGRGTLLGRE